MEAILYKSNPWREENFSFKGYERKSYMVLSVKKRE